MLQVTVMKQSKMCTLHITEDLTEIKVEKITMLMLIFLAVVYFCKCSAIPEEPSPPAQLTTPKQIK